MLSIGLYSHVISLALPKESKSSVRPQSGTSLCSRSNVDQVGLPQMALRFSHLPPGLRQLVLGQHSPFLHTRHAHRLSRNAFFFKAPLPTPGLGRRALWLIPVAGGIGFLLKPQPQSVLPQVLQDDAFIPCNRHTPRPQPIIYSPYEADQSLLCRFGSFLRNTILEPLVTAGRFAYLFCLFFPVILASPMLLIGSPTPGLQGDRWGAVWWYGLLVSQMERAGPTFIKVPDQLCFRDSIL